MTDGYRIAYGFERAAADFRPYGVSPGKLYLDGPKTNRTERRALMADLRRNDVIVLLAVSDLGDGKGLQNIRAEIEARGASIEVVEPVSDPSKTKGRPPRWSPTPEQDERFRGLWSDVSVDGGYIIDRACEVTGENRNDQRVRERMRQRLIRKYGHRGQRKER
jgi:hypothetical protein